MSSTPSDWVALWQSVSEAGGIDRYVDQQLQTHGFVVERRDTEGMSKRELERYK